MHNMDTNVYIASGILESYCLGLVTGAEREEVELYAKKYPEIREELSKINDLLETYALEKGMIEIKTMRKIEKGEELTINYNGNWNDDKKVWFEVVNGQ